MIANRVTVGQFCIIITPCIYAFTFLKLYIHNPDINTAKLYTKSTAE